jgi:hypothetical protein
MLTEVVASYAAVVSTAALALSYVSYRASGPQLSGNAYIYGRYDVDGPTLHVLVYNRGRGAVTVRDLWLWASNTPRRSPCPVMGWPLRWTKGTLPARIEGQSGEHFSFPGHLITRDWLTRRDLERMDVAVQLANGKTLWLPVDTDDIDVLDPDNLPDWDPDYFKDWPALPRLKPSQRRARAEDHAGTEDSREDSPPPKDQDPA